MSVGDFFTRVFTEILKMNVIQFIVCALGLYFFIKDFRKIKASFRELPKAWRESSIKERWEGVSAFFGYAVLMAIFVLPIVWVFNTCTGDFSYCVRKVNDTVCRMATKNERAYMKEDGTCGN
jgi:hypothetical protein